MKRACILCCGLLILLMVSSTVVFSYALSCDGGVITTGDRSSDVLAKCGAPDYKESHQEELSQRYDSNTRAKVFITVEEWTYDFGGTRLTRIVTIKNGTVTDIQETHYST